MMSNFLNDTYLIKIGRTYHKTYRAIRSMLLNSVQTLIQIKYWITGSITRLMVKPVDQCTEQKM